MKYRKLTVTVGIPAFNEEKNIENLIRSVIGQKNNNYSLSEIMVVSDGSTDGTDSIVKRLKKRYRSVTLLSDGNRRGKGRRLMELYKRNRSDIFIQFDGDTVLGGRHVIEDLIRPFKSRKVAVVGGNGQPVFPDSFFGKLLYKWNRIWYEVRKDSGGETIHNAHSFALALRKDFVRRIDFHPAITSEGQYIYCKTRSLNYRYHYAVSARVYYRLPENIHDYLRQINRSKNEAEILKNIFGSNISSYYLLPGKKKKEVLVNNVLNDPFFTILSGVVTTVLSFFPGRSSRRTDGTWLTAVSTKKAINQNTLTS